MSDLDVGYCSRWPVRRSEPGEPFGGDGWTRTRRVLDSGPEYEAWLADVAEHGPLWVVPL